MYRTELRWNTLYRAMKHHHASLLAIQCMANEYTRQTNKHRVRRIYILRKVGKKRRYMNDRANIARAPSIGMFAAG